MSSPYKIVDDSGKPTAFDKLKVETITVKHSRFNLPAFSFLVCFAMLMIRWASEIDSAGTFFLTAGCAALISLVGWVLVAVLLKLAFVLPLRAVSHFNRVASVCYLISFAALMWYMFTPGDDVLNILFDMACSALLAVPCCLVLVIPGRILSRFLGDLFGKK